MRAIYNQRQIDVNIRKRKPDRLFAANVAQTSRTTLRELVLCFQLHCSNLSATACAFYSVAPRIGLDDPCTRYELSVIHMQLYRRGYMKRSLKRAQPNKGGSSEKFS